MEIIIKEHIIKVNDKEIYGKLYYPKETGKFSSIILSHGYNGCNDDFERECRCFAENGFLAYAYDFCGGSTRSKSSGKSTDMTIFTEKADLLDVVNDIRNLENVDKEKVYLMGGSQGGLVTMLAAEEVENLINGVMVYYPALNIPHDWRNKFLSEEDVPEVIDFWGLQLGKKFALAIRDFHTFDNIGKFSKDVLIIHGDKDNIAILENSKKAKEIYKNLELIVLKGEGHGYTPEGTKIASEHMVEFLKNR